MNNETTIRCAICGETFPPGQHDRYDEHHSAHVQGYLNSMGCSADSDPEKAASDPNNPTPDVDVSRLSDGRYALTGRNAREAIIAPEEDWAVIGR